MKSQKKEIQWGYIFLGILFILVSVYMFFNVSVSLVSIILIFSILAICKGGLELVSSWKIKEIKGIFIGIIDILIGIYLLFHVYLGLFLLPYVFAVWFILDSVGLLLDHIKYVKEKRASYWLILVLDIFGVFIGISLFFNPIVSALTLSFLVSIYLFIAGINYIISSRSMEIF